MTEISREVFNVLVVDDDASIRTTYRHILQPPPSELGGLEALISGGGEVEKAENPFLVVEADQGETAAKLQRAALEQGQRFPLAFIDMRMPPGWDGMRTAVALRAQDPSIYIVIATAFSDYDVNALQRALQHDVVLLRKPFNQEEVFQLARTLCQSWETRQRLEAVTAEMESHVRLSSAELDRRSALQAALVEIITRFVETGADEGIDDAVYWSLARFGRSIDVDGCALFRFDAARDFYTLAYEWHALGVKALPLALHRIERVDIAPAHACFLRGERFLISCLDELPAEMQTLRQLLGSYYEGVLAVPLEIGGRLVGFLAIGMTQDDAEWNVGLEKLMLTVGHAITSAIEAHDASQRLRDSQAMLARTESLSHIGSWEWDVETEAVKWSDEMFRIFQLPVAVAPSLAEQGTFFHPDDMLALRLAMDTAVNQGTPYELQMRVLRRDGSSRICVARGEVDRGLDGRVIRLFGLLQDITHRVMQETALAATAEFVTAPAGADFCADLVIHAARTLDLDYVHIARLSPCRKCVITEAAWLDGKLIPNWTYELVGTPCSDVVNQARQCILTGVQGLYPDDADLRGIGAESYVGEPIVSSTGEVLGLIVAVKRTPLSNQAMVQDNLRILAARVAAEWAHKEVLRALSAERDFTHNVLQTAEALIVAFDLDGRITLINRKGCELFGYDEAELIGQDWFSTCLPEDLDVDMIRAIFHKALVEDLAGSEYFENPVRTRAGDQRLIAWHNSTIRDAENKVIGAMSAGMDVTERRRTEARLRASEERFHRLFEDADTLAIQGYLADGEVVYWNRASETLYGYSAEEAIGGNLLDLIIPAQMRADAAAIVREMCESGHSIPPGRRLLQHKSGRPVPIYSSHAVVRAPDHPTLLFCMDLDMSELDRTEAALNVALIKYKTLFDCFPMGITVTDAEGRILESNATAAKLLGLSQLEQSLRRIDGPEWRIVRTDGTPMPPDEFASVRALKERRRVENVELGIVKAEGAITWISVTADLLPLEGYGIVVSYSDITERREAVERIRKLAYFDPLTDLPNRRLLMDRLGHAMTASQRSREYGALLMLDLDYFKVVNDTRGHDVGDKLLVEVAQRLLEHVRQADTVARLGGDEYVVMLDGLGEEPEAAARQAALVAEKIRVALALPYRFDDAEPITESSASIGLTLFQGTAQAPEAVLKQADVALYQAKSDGRNRVCLG